MLRVRMSAAEKTCSITNAIGSIDNSRNPVELSSFNRPSAPKMSPITKLVTGGIYAIKATTANVITPIVSANLLTRKGSCLLANKAKAVFCVPFVATDISWKKPKAIATAAIETTGSGDLAIPAVRIGCVPAGSSAANNRGEKNLVIDLIEGLAIFDVPSNLRSG